MNISYIKFTLQFISALLFILFLYNKIDIVPKNQLLNDQAIGISEKMIQSAGDHELAPGYDQQNKARVLLMGTFHFANLGFDYVKTDQIDVMNEINQLYLTQLAERIASFNPTGVLLEYGPGDDEQVNAEYQEYLNGNFVLPANEMYQLGFRVAKAAGLKEVHGYDERDIHWQAQPMLDLMNDKYPEVQKAFQHKIDDLTDALNQDHARKSLKELLFDHNDPERDRYNKALYIITNSVGAGVTFEGADAAASWWHRNFRMYANIQKHATPGSKIFVLGGQGHTAIFRDLLNLDDAREETAIHDYL